jgi:hypothetical protein
MNGNTAGATVGAAIHPQTRCRAENRLYQYLGKDADSALHHETSTTTCWRSWRHPPSAYALGRIATGTLRWKNRETRRDIMSSTSASASLLTLVLILTGIKDLTVGAVFQNPISFAGDPERPDGKQPD